MMVLIMLSPLLVVGFIVMAVLEEKKRNQKNNKDK
ncbi:membrane protein [Staphylococcus caeli]|uniref:Membrane protein n=1 Tax=Staphylococcus caeli TaxID=2201815 RepID=A0A1D4JRL8_9STAP|nr:membrane protein [Staphylococcus caeli]SCS88468.1 membrane protein [Staphylococcus caeli]